MDLEYLHDQICDELHGACDYIKKAIESKSTRPEWANKLHEMSSVELKHAETLMRFFNDLFNEISSAYSIDNMPPFLKECKDKTMEKYEEMYPKIKYLSELYSK